MADCCSGGCSSSKPPVDPRYRRILWIALWVNALMFGVELVAGWAAGSVALLADAVDFLGDAANYGISLFVLGLAPIWRSRTALLKGATMGGYGVFVLGTALWHLQLGTVPKAETMGAVGFLALIANCSVGVLLWAYRNGDANMRSVWLCTRNDAISNLAVMLAALGVFGLGSGLPDLLVASIMGLLGLSAAYSVIRHARREMREGPAPAPEPQAAAVELKRR
ncbi:cation transporter [Massilia sp. IC2-476]|uniref:cation transporter n=1 Tax=Massilia sp. IC2-476 TaxID=2887199 RepID=UPI001D114AE0|nr:cation transporter [Massilia sp. IC2-476]MCC2974521.1 cation transporter [Massilia sp. IC2-476]